jgi:hypothetical protein
MVGAGPVLGQTPLGRASAVAAKDARVVLDVRERLLGLNRTLVAIPPIPQAEEPTDDG